MRSKGKRLASIIAAFFLLTILAAAAFAVPQTINYQGYLEGSGGVPVNGTVSMTFAIYNAPTGGSALWTETQPSVAVTDGAFSVVLGNVTTINLPFDEQYHLGVTVDGDPEMAPRAVLVGVPYAMRAKKADSANTAGYAETAGAANTAAILGNKTLSELVALLDGRYGNLGDSLVADFSATPLTVGVDNPVSFTDLSQGVPQSWLWDFGDTGTSTLQNPSHTYTSDGVFTVSLSAGDGVTSNTATKVGYITVHSVPSGTIVPGDGSEWVGEYTSIAIGKDGLPVVSYSDAMVGGLKVFHCGIANCTLGTIYTVGSTGSGVADTSIASGVDDLPVISYAGNGLMVAHCGDALCSSGNTITTVDSTENVGGYSSIAIGTDGMPVISYYDAINLDLKVAHCGDALCSSGNTITTVDSAGYVGSSTSIAIGADDLPVISYAGDGLMVAHCGIANCSSGNTITTVDSAGSVGKYTSIAIGADGMPVVSYYDNTNLDLKVVHCGIANCTSGNTITTVDSAGDVGQYTSIAIGADNLPVVSYYDATNLDLKVAHCGDASCTTGNTITTVEDWSLSMGEYTSIAIGTDGLPVISYFDGTNHNLMVAKCGDAACSLW